ncbi:MAG: cation transporter [Planctomycetota bacterium]|nr:MAG: cation transporter [Planctomycetota bacterium]
MDVSKPGFPPSAMESHPHERSRTALRTVKVAAALLLMKALTYAFTSSAGILGSTLDSMLDVLASLLVLMGVLAAERPADADHPWGHGKAESLASLAQAVFILLSGLGLAIETVQRFVNQEAEVRMQSLGIGTMVVSSAVTWWWVGHLKRAAAATDSPALEADTLHYTSDLLMNAAVILGLASSHFLDAAWPDLAVGLGIALLILNTAREVLKKAVENLMDRGLDTEEAATILREVSRFAPAVGGFHDLRTRRSGRDIFLEIHLDMDRNLSFVEAHELSEKVGHAIETALPRSRVTVHADPL